MSTSRKPLSTCDAINHDALVLRKLNQAGSHYKSSPMAGGYSEDFATEFYLQALSAQSSGRA